MELLNREAEERLLAEIGAASSLDIDDTRTGMARMGLTAEVFAHDDTRAVFDVMRGRLAAGAPCGVLQVEAELKKLNPAANWGWLIGRQLAAEGLLMFAVPWADELKELSARRKLRAVGLDLAARATNPATGVDESLAHLGAQMNSLVSGSSARARTLDEKLELVARQLQEVGTEANATVIKTGMDMWDRNVGGLWPTLNVIGGHPSRGKSALAAAMMLGLAKQGIPGIVFSMEDNAEWLLYRYLASASRVPGFLMRTRPLTEAQQGAVGEVWEEIRAAAKFIMFDERSRLTPAQLVAAARDAILTRGARWVVADHAGEFSYTQHRKGERMDQDIAEGLSEMRAIAKTHGVPFVLLSQLTRSAKPPHGLQDFKNASAIEEAARVACIVWTRDGAPLEPVVSCVKNTNGKRDFDMRFALDPVSGLLMEAPSPTDMQANEQEPLL